ncbi:hypothetical protein V1478_007604 [Vespula squamosa]|uniref:Uncharacterized protein n=1 Tax=Vespula squamosa TaxID=30214 RepID=A0ABD2B3T2_VESSQ
MTNVAYRDRHTHIRANIHTQTQGEFLPTYVAAYANVPASSSP